MLLVSSLGRQVEFLSVLSIIGIVAVEQKRMEWTIGHISTVTEALDPWDTTMDVLFQLSDLDNRVNQ